MNQVVSAIVVICCTFACGAQTAAGGDLKLTETDDKIRITLRGKPVLEYVKTARPVPSGIAKHFRRSGYIHPVYSPTGEKVTGDYPADHAHQHALFFAWTKSSYDGQETDFWNQAKELAGVEFREIVDVTRGDSQVSFRAKHAFTVGQGDTRVDALMEIWKVTVHQTPEDHFLFDIESVQQCVTDKPLVLKKHHYGGMAFRGNVEWLKDKEDRDLKPGDLRFLTSEGKGRLDGNHTRPNWVALNGRLGGQDVSVSVFGNLQNFRAPQHVRLHPNKPYFCFAPAVVGQFKIEPGQKYVSRYRYLVRSELATAQDNKAHWERYAKSPE